MPKTPEMGDLTSVRSEVEQVAAVLLSTQAIHLSSPSKRVVLEKPPSCTIFYFAGHGKVDTADDPTTSRHVVINLLASVPTVTSRGALRTYKSTK
ncbi:hypothetical protein BDV39DRAFT_204606 [Aspergillus sergii]|uniref:Uncharacterized protein n=1 Tax=Aspergillus sergii TaxID=1034303 RepID=A0A5N6X4N3_9EURO|nr:hypothetical protein BDV39DRAFT_204606 [Aspergillus sergii]